MKRLSLRTSWSQNTDQTGGADEALIDKHFTFNTFLVQVCPGFPMGALKAELLARIISLDTILIQSKTNVKQKPLHFAVM